jgi:uncharacterized membrane protein required for colicin V production
MMFLAAAPIQTEVDWNAVYTHMGWFDVVTLIMFLVGIAFGLRKGLAKALQLIVVVMVAEAVTLQYSELITDFVHAQIPIPKTGLHVVAFLFLALVVMTVIYFSFAILSLIATIQFKNGISRVGGFLSGGFLAILFWSLIASLLILIPMPFVQDVFNEGSITGGPLVQLGVWAHDFVFKWIPETLHLVPKP